MANIDLRVIGSPNRSRIPPLATNQMLMQQTNERTKFLDGKNFLNLEPCHEQSASGEDEYTAASLPKGIQSNKHDLDYNQMPMITISDSSEGETSDADVTEMAKSARHIMSDQKTERKKGFSKQTGK